MESTKDETEHTKTTDSRMIAARGAVLDVAFDKATLPAIEDALIVTPARFSGAKNLSRNASTDPHARIFGLSLAALLAACLVLNAGSPSTRICQLSERDFGAGADSGSPAPEGGSHASPFGTIRSKECATYQGGEEPGY